MLRSLYPLWFPAVSIVIPVRRGDRPVAPTMLI